MGKYSKAWGTIVGGLVGLGLTAIGIDEAIMPTVAGPLTDAFITILFGAIGTYVAPKNAD